MVVDNLPKFKAGGDKPSCDYCIKKGKDVPAVMYCTVCTKKHCEKHKEVGWLECKYIVDCIGLNNLN